MIEIRKNLSSRELKFFGLGIAFLTFVLALWFSGRTGWNDYWTALVVAGCLLGSLGWIWPEGLRRVYLAWSYATLPIGWVVSHLVLALIFYGLFTCVALLMRLFRYDPLARRIEKERDSYWEERQATPEHRRYFRQY